MRRLLRENGLSIVWMGLFFLTLIFGQSVVGQREYNNEQKDHGRPEVGFVEYLQSAHFVEATMEKTRRGPSAKAGSSSSSTRTL